MKVSVSLISLFSFATLVVDVHCERVNCKVIPFETRDGLSGTCCVFYKNVSTETAFPKEEVAKQMTKEGGPNGSKNNGGNDRNREGGPTGPNGNGHPTVPNGTKNGDEKVVFVDDQRQNWQNRTSPTINKGLPPNVTISNKNAFDTPEKCPEGKLRDHTGACTEPF